MTITECISLARRQRRAIDALTRDYLAGNWSVSGFREELNALTNAFETTLRILRENNRDEHGRKL